MTVGVTVVTTSGVGTTGFKSCVGGARLFPPPRLSLNDAQSSQPVAVSSGCQNSGGGSVHQSGGSGNSHTSTSVGSGGSSIVRVGLGAPMSFESPVGDRGGAVVGVVTMEAVSGVLMYVGAVVLLTSAAYQYNVFRQVHLVSAYAHGQQSSRSGRRASEVLAAGACRRYVLFDMQLRSIEGDTSARSGGARWTPEGGGDQTVYSPKERVSRAPWPIDFISPVYPVAQRSRAASE